MAYTEEQLNKLFWGIAIDLQEAIKDKLIELKIKFTGAAISSVRATVEKDKIVVRMNDYLEYIEYGMPNPTSPDELYNWVKNKILDDYKGKNKDAAIKRVSETIANSITLFGPRPRPFLRPVLHQQLPLIIQRNVDRLSA